MLELTTFCLTLCSTNLARRVARITNDLVNLFTILTKYHEFTNVFSKARAKTLALYYLYNLQIKLEDREKLSIRTIYLLSTTKQEAFKEFISRNLNTRFIQLISSPYGVLVLFIKKKDSFFHLCVDF